MNKFILPALIEAGKEILRDVILAVIPVLLSGINTETGKFSIVWPVVGAVALTVALRGIDRYLHVYLSSKAPKIDKGNSFGLVRI